MTDSRSGDFNPLEAGVTQVPGTDDYVATGPAGVAYMDTEERGDDYVDPELRKGRGLAVLALGASQAIDNSEGGVVNTIFPLLAQAFGIEKTHLGIISSISKFARGILGPTWAILADKFGKKLILFIVTGLWGLWTVATGFAPDFTWFLILYSIAVCGTVASEPILNGLMGDLFARSERGKAFGLVRGIGTGAGMVLTPLIALFGSENFAFNQNGNFEGWRYAMFAMGGLSVLSGILILMFVKEPKRQKGSKVSDDPDSGVFKLSDGFKLFKIPTVVLIALMLPLVTSMVLFAFMNTFWVEIYGWTIPQGGLLYSVFSAGAVLGSIVGGLAADKVVQKFGPKGRIAMMQVYLVSFAVVTFLAFQLPWGTHWFYWVMIAILGFVFPIGFSACVLPMVSTVVPTQLNATGFAMLFSLVQGIITAVMTILVGILADSNLGFQNTLLYFVSGAYALNAVYWFVFYKAYPKDMALQKERTAQVAAGTF